MVYHVCTFMLIMYIVMSKIHFIRTINIYHDSCLSLTAALEAISRTAYRIGPDDRASIKTRFTTNNTPNTCMHREG